MISSVWPWHGGNCYTPAPRYSWWCGTPPPARFSGQKCWRNLGCTQTTAWTRPWWRPVPQVWVLVRSPRKTKKVKMKIGEKWSWTLPSNHGWIAPVLSCKLYSSRRLIRPSWDRVLLVLLTDWFYQMKSVMRLVYSIGINPDRPAMVL